MIQRLPFSYPGIKEDIAQLEKCLQQLFTQLDLNFPKKLSVLNLACGRADETGAIACAVLPAEIDFYLGIDLRTATIEEAAKRWKLPAGTISFMEGNAASIGRMDTLPKFDLIFIRHQNYWHEPLVWEGILDEALIALSDRGVLICTSYFDREHELLLASLREKNTHCAVNFRNQPSRSLPDAEGKSVDRWISIHQRSTRS